MFVQPHLRSCFGYVPSPLSLFELVIHSVISKQK